MKILIIIITIQFYLFIRNLKQREYILGQPSNTEKTYIQNHLLSVYDIAILFLCVYVIGKQSFIDNPLPLNSVH